MRFEITYEAEYVYPHPARDNLNALRVKPSTAGSQNLEAFELRVAPEARVREHRDYFGTSVLEFEVDEPHERMALSARATVQADDPIEPPYGTWDELARKRYRDAGREFLLRTEHIPEHDGFSGLMADSKGAETPFATAMRITELIPQRFEYRPGTTFVDTTVADLLDVGAGVCQDFVHLALMVLREYGIGARYVSGYLFAAPKDGGADSVEVQTHAWVEALIPAGEAEPRWVGLDPTNGGLALATHVKIGHGRHYQDVPPIRGVYKGPAATELHANVRMRRISGAD